MFANMTVWMLGAFAILLTIVSAFGFLNAFYFKNHGPGVDLGLIAGVLALAAWAAARWEQKDQR